MKNKEAKAILEAMSKEELVDLCLNYRDIINEFDEKDTDFEEFWKKYHEVTGLKKTDYQAAKKHWGRLTKVHRKLALENIEKYFLSLPTYNSGKPVKKARTYLADKNFLDEFEVAKSDSKPASRTDGKPKRISIDQVAVNNYSEWEQYCKENNYDSQSGESLI